MLIKFKKIRHILPIIFLGIAVFAILIFFGLSQVKAINITGSWLQTDSSALETGFNLAGNVKTQTGVRGTGPGAGVGLTHAIINPVQVGLYADNTFQDVFVSGQYAYAAQGSSADFKVINISNPQSPILVATRGALDLASDIQVVGSYIYTTSQSDVRGLQIFNTSSPTIRVGILVIPTKAYGLAVSGNYAYVTSYGIGANGKLTVVDVSNPASPFEVGSATLPTNATGKPYVQGNYLYVSDSSTGLLIFDVSNPNTPTQVGIYNTPDVAYDVFVDGDYAYVADFASGLQIINISNPANPTLTGIYNTPNSARSVYVSEGHAYVGDGTSLQIIDVTNPNSPVFKKSFITTNDFDMFVDGDYAYVADNNLGLRVIKVREIFSSGAYASAIYDTAQTSTFTNLTFSSTVPANYTQWAQTTDADFGAGTNATTIVSGSGDGGSVKLSKNVDDSNGSDGACSITSINTDTKSVYNCQNVTISGNVNVSGSLPLVIKAAGDVTINGVLNANGLSTGVSTGANGTAGGARGGNGNSSGGSNGLGLGFGGGGGGSSNGGGGAGF